jgi:hypothetical protein
VRRHTRGQAPAEPLAGTLRLASSQAGATVVPRRTRLDKIDKLVSEALAIEEHDAAEAGAIGYMARVFVQTTIPHRKVAGAQFERSNGSFHLTITSTNARLGLPYGSYPRLLLAWLTTEAVRTKQPVIELGRTLSSFMRELGLMTTGGRWGTIPRLRDQMLRLFSAAIACHYDGAGEAHGQGMMLADNYSLWWEPKAPDQIALWQSTVTLSARFFEEVVNRPVPMDMRALRALKQSPLALDVYAWLSYRMSYLSKRTVVPWRSLELQFGCDYARTRAFREKFLQQLRAVRLVYPAAQVEPMANGLELRPSFTHVPRARAK